LLNRFSRKYKILAGSAVILAFVANYFIGSSEEVDRLLAKAKRGDSSQRVKAVSELGRLGPGASSGISELRNYVRDADPSVRRATARALLRIDRNEAIKALLWAFDDKDAGVRMDAAEALERTGSKKAMQMINQSRAQHSVVREKERIESWAEGMRREYKKKEKKRYKRHKRIYGGR